MIGCLVTLATSFLNTGQVFPDQFTAKNCISKFQFPFKEALKHDL